MANMLRAYATLSGISSFQILAMFRRGLFYTFMALYIREYLGLSVTETTLFATLPMLSSSLCQMFLWGNVSDRLQLRRSLILIGEILAAIGTVALYYAHLMPESKSAAAYVIIVGLTIIEIFWSMSNIGWSALLSDIYAPEERSSIQGQLFSIGAIGRIIGVYIGGLLYDGLGAHYRGWGFREGSLFFVAAAAMLLSTVPMLFVPEGGIKEETKQKDGADIGGSANYSASLFMLFLTAIALINIGRNSMAVLRTPFLSLEEGLALSPQQIQWAVNVQSVAMILMGPAVGLVCRRFGDAQALIGGSILAMASLLVFGYAPTLPIACFGNFLEGLSAITIMASSYTLASLLIPKERRARLFGWFNATLFLSWGTGGTLIVGPLIDLLMHRGMAELAAYRMGFIAATAITATGTAVLAYLLFVVMKQKQDEEPASPEV